MAQIESLNRELDCLKNCVHRQQSELNKQKKELSTLRFNSNLSKDSWQSPRQEIDFLKEDFRSQYNYCCDLDDRTRYFEFDENNSSLEKDALWGRINKIEEGLANFTQLHLQLKDAVLAFKNKDKNIIKATLRMGNKVQNEDLKIELIID